MNRSRLGLAGAGEWHEFRQMMPDLSGKNVLDLGCGMGWHCRYATENGAASVVGVDISGKMLERAKEINGLEGIIYLQQPLEESEFTSGQFDVVLSSLAFHYLASFDWICQQIFNWLKPGGQLLFSVEHPVFTSRGDQDWIYDESGKKLFWPVDDYYVEGKRQTFFLGEQVVKYHRTLTTYINGLLQAGFEVKKVVEPQPESQMLLNYPEMLDELRRPMMLLVAAAKPLTIEHSPVNVDH